MENEIRESEQWFASVQEPVLNGHREATVPTFRLGARGEIDPFVVLGYTFPGWSSPAIIGDDSVIRTGSVIYANTWIGHHFTCGHHVVVRANCKIGNDVVILHQTTLEGNLQIGDGVKVMAQVYLPSKTRIGNRVFIGPGTTFLNSKYPMRGLSEVQGATVEDGVCIGGGVTVCPGVTIGRGAMIGAGAVVNKDIPPNTLAYGVPARIHPLPENLPHENVTHELLNSADLWGRSSGIQFSDHSML